MKNKAIVILVVCAILLTANAVQGSALHQGKLVVFSGATLGYEEFSISPEGITTGITYGGFVKPSPLKRAYKGFL